MKMTVREARAHFGAMVDEASQGGEVVITRRGRPVARVVAVDSEAKRLPDMHAFRRRMECKGKPVSATVAAERDEG